MGKGIFEETRYKPLITSELFEKQRSEIYQYGFSAFGYQQAVRYRLEIRRVLGMLPTSWLMFPECCYLPTKNHRYCNIILPAHRIIYRVAPQRIEVLTILHFASSVASIRKTRDIRI